MLQLLALLVIVFCVGTIVGEEYTKRHPRHHEITLAEALEILEADTLESVNEVAEMFHRPYRGRNDDSFYDGRQEGWV